MSFKSESQALDAITAKIREYVAEQGLTLPEFKREMFRIRITYEVYIEAVGTNFFPYVSTDKKELVFIQPTYNYVQFWNVLKHLLHAAHESGTEYDRDIENNPFL